MERILLATSIILVLLISGCIQFLLAPKNSGSYVACGCGCCGGYEPVKQCLYHSKGDDLNAKINDDSLVKLSPQCAYMGCSRGINYTYCD